MSDTPDTAIWVVSDVAPDGTYVTTVHATDDVAFTLTPSEAMTYAAAVMDASARAQFDAAVVAQLLTTGMDMRLAVSVVVDLRAERPPLVFGTPLSFEPFVMGPTREPKLWVLVNGAKYAQWAPADARQHAMQVLEVAAGVDLDAAYRRFLVGPIGMDDEKARALVGALANHRAGVGGV